MLLASRQKKILDILNRQGNVKVTDLASYFGVSEVTARRDLDMLADQSYLVRVRGGALSNRPGTPKAKNSTNLPFQYGEILVLCQTVLSNFLVNPQLEQRSLPIERYQNFLLPQ